MWRLDSISVKFIKNLLEIVSRIINYYWNFLIYLQNICKSKFLKIELNISQILKNISPEADKGFLKFSEQLVNIINFPLKCPNFLLLFTFGKINQNYFFSFPKTPVTFTIV